MGNNNKRNGKTSDFKKRGANTRGTGNKSYDSGTKSEGFDSKEARHNQKNLKGKTRASNDPGWYGVDSVLMKDAASIPFSHTAGLPFDLSNPQISAGKHTLPGIMAIYNVPTPGMCGNWDDPVNVAIRDLYGEIRRANSGAKNYDAANLGMYLQVYDSACTYYAWMVRIYGMMRSVIPGNRYTPEDIINTMRVDYDSILENMAQFRAYINTYAARLYALKIPSKWHVVERHMWMYSNVFADAPTAKAQFYVFNPYAFWKYNLGNTPETTGLYLKAPWEFGEKFFMCGYQDIVNFGNELLNSVLNDEDFNIMSGDILKTFGDKVFKINMIDEQYAVSPMYDPEVLLQIHNCSVITPNITWSDIDPHPMDFQELTWSIKEDYSESTNVGAIVLNAPFYASLTYDGYYPAQNLVSAANLLVDVPIDNPDPTIVCIATRLKVGLKIDSIDAENTTVYMSLKSCGTEIPVQITLFTRKIDLDEHNDSDSYGNLRAWSLQKARGEWESFSDRPVYIYPEEVTNVSGGSTTTLDLGDYDVVGPVDNYTIMSQETLYNIHRAALLGMYEMTK